MSWLPGTAKLSFHHHPDSARLYTRSGAYISLADLCKQATPPCVLNPLLCSKHLQTAWTMMPDKEAVVHYKRRLFASGDPQYPGTFAVDFAIREPPAEDPERDPDDATIASPMSAGEKDELGADDDKPMAVLVHGIAGSSKENYVKHTVVPLLAAGFEVCVVISRGCGQSRLTSSMLFHARSTWDLRQTVNVLHKRFPRRPLYAVGFSMGANILVNYLAEEGAATYFRAAVVCANPWNLETVHLHLHRHRIGRQVYSRYMAGRMKRLVLNNANQVLRNENISLQEVEKIKYLYEYDSAVQLPTWGFPTRGTYYRSASSVDSVLAVQIPLFAINALDDPISVHEALPYDEAMKNPFTVLCTTSTGGHLAWFQPDGGRWYTHPIVRFFRLLQKEIVQVEVPDQRAPPEEPEVVM